MVLVVLMKIIINFIKGNQNSLQSELRIKGPDLCTKVPIFALRSPYKSSDDFYADTCIQIKNLRNPKGTSLNFEIWLTTCLGVFFRNLEEIGRIVVRVLNRKDWYDKNIDLELAMTQASVSQAGLGLRSIIRS